MTSALEMATSEALAPLISLALELSQVHTSHPHAEPHWFTSSHSRSRALGMLAGARAHWPRCPDGDHLIHPRSLGMAGDPLKWREGAGDGEGSRAWP